MLTELDWFGHWGYFFIMVGQYFIGCKDRMGWLLRLFGEVLWVTIGMTIGMTSIWSWGLVFMAVDVYNYRKWHREEKEAILAETVEDLANAAYLDHVQNDVMFDDDFNVKPGWECVYEKPSDELDLLEKEYGKTKTSQPRRKATTKRSKAKSRRKKVSKVQGKVRQAGRRKGRSVRRVQKKMSKV